MHVLHKAKSQSFRSFLRTDHLLRSDRVHQDTIFGELKLPLIKPASLKWIISQYEGCSYSRYKGYGTVSVSIEDT